MVAIFCMNPAVELVQAQVLGLEQLCHEIYQNLQWEMPANMSET